MPLLRLLAQIHPTPEDYWKVGLIIGGICAAIGGVIGAWLWIDSRWVRRVDYERDMKDRDQRLANDNQRDEKFSKKIDELIQAIKHKK